VQKKFSQSFSLPKDLIDRIEETSRRTGQPKSLLVRNAIEKHLKELDADVSALRKVREMVAD
jgi:predicted DNA-binding protein